MINATGLPTSGHHPADGQLARPTWAEHTEFYVDSIDRSATITHTWTAPTPGDVAVGGDAPRRCHVQLSQEVRIDSPDGALNLQVGAPYIFLSSLDARFTSTEQARAFAANLLACCDRLDGVA